MPKSNPIAAAWQPHRWDRPFFAGMLVAIWAAILSGFIYHNVRKYNTGQLRYPLIVHVHGLFFAGWLLLFTVQEMLVQAGS